MTELERLQKKIEELERWKAERTAQQFVFPLDTKSQEILRKDLLVATGKSVVPGNLLSNTTALEVKIDDKLYWILVSPTP